ncbi:MAG TPA: glycosyltransferase, partial [Flavobacterium sp.]|nr:glycosyltransferase [Flavobacterium sp.]
NGIDTTHFNLNQISEEQKENLKNSLEIQPEDFVFIFVGRIVKDKGINELISAFSSFSSLRGTKQSAKLLLVGNYERELDPLLPETEKIIDTNPNIITTGYQQDVRPYFAVSDCLVFPSYREGFPNVVMQAGAMGLPSIVTNINGCNEIIINQKNGIIIPVKNTEELIQAMLLNSEKYQALKKESRNMITSRYEQKVVWNEILKEYRSLILSKKDVK